VAVVGFDDLGDAAQTRPPLTTIRQPLGDMTAALVELLLRQVEGTGTEDGHVVCPTTLVRRASA
jgi:LacI family transcriptional regulator